MRIKTPGDVLATAIAWFPFLAILAFVGWVLMVGAVNLEVRTTGSNVLISDRAAPSPDYYRHNAGDTLVTPF